MKRMVDNKKINDIGIVEYAKFNEIPKIRYYSKILFTYDSDDVSGYSITIFGYNLKKHITENIECSDLEEFIGVCNEYFIGDGKDFTWDNDNDVVKVNNFIFELNQIHISSNNSSETITSTSEPNILYFEITDMFTGNHIVVDL